MNWQTKIIIALVLAWVLFLSIITLQTPEPVPTVDPIVTVNDPMGICKAYGEQTYTKIKVENYERYYLIGVVWYEEEVLIRSCLGNSE